MKGKKSNNIGSNAGLTLVELIVTFALIGIFMVSATFVLSNSLRMFQRMESTSKAVTVSDLILDKISGEIAAADVDREGKNEGYYFCMGEDADISGSGGSPWIAFENRSKSPVSIYEDEGKLVIKYYGITEADKVGTGVKPVQEIDWKFDENVYMGYRIENLSFSRPQPSDHPNVVRIDLSLKHQTTGFTYSTYRYAENYNYDGTGTRLGMLRDSEGEIENDLPSEAKDFTYPADWETTEPTEPPEPTDPPKKPEYSIYFYSINSGKEIADFIIESGELNEKIIVAGSSKPLTGKTVIGPFPIRYYEYLPGSSFDECMLDGIKSPVLELNYRPSDTDLVPITIRCINRENGEEIENQTKTVGYKIESSITIEPEELDGYVIDSTPYHIVVSATTTGPYDFYYIPSKQNDGSVTVTDSEGNKHTLYPNGMTWEEIKKYAREHDGYYSSAVATKLCDETGFYIVINGLEVPKTIGDKTLEEFAKSNNKVIKISEDTKIFIESDLIYKNGEKVWPEDYPKRGDLVYFRGVYYIAQGSNKYDMPPNGIWIKLP